MQSFNDRLISGEKYYGTIDWYVQDFCDHVGRGSLYIKVFLSHHEAIHVTFQVHEDDIEPEYKVLVGFVSTKLVLKPGDVVEFIADLDSVNGHKARKIKFYGTKASAKAKFREQEWNFRLGLVHGASTEKVVWKLATRPRREDE